MFSQFRQVVETLVQDSTNPAGESSANSRSRSLDANTSSPPLAESNLRKSLAAQRVANSPQRRSTSPGPSSLPKHATDVGARKSRLEERLRATFTIGDSPGSTTPNPSSRASPAPDASIAQHPLSPESIPLPGSPTQPVVRVPQSPISLPKENNVPVDDLGSSSPQPQNSIDPPSAQDGTDVGAAVSSEPTPEPTGHDTLTQPGDIIASHPGLPSNEEIETVDIQPAISSVPNNGETAFAPASVSVKSCDTDVEALQERLKLVEQRFAGDFFVSPPT